MGAHYIKDPIFMRGNYLTEKRTYGNSGFPFHHGVTSREYNYGPELVPGAVEALSTVVVWGLHEHLNENDIRDTAAAINKVANGL